MLMVIQNLSTSQKLILNELGLDPTRQPDKNIWDTFEASVKQQWEDLGFDPSLKFTDIPAALMNEAVARIKADMEGMPHIVQSSFSENLTNINLIRWKLYQTHKNKFKLNEKRSGRAGPSRGSRGSRAGGDRNTAPRSIDHSAMQPTDHDPTRVSRSAVGNRYDILEEVRDHRRA